MKKKAVFGLIAAFIAIDVFAGPVLLPDGNYWQQPVDFLDTSYNDVAAVCSVSDGSCSGSLNGIDLTGWTWASLDEFVAAIDSLSSESITAGSLPVIIVNSEFGPATLNLFTNTGSDVGYVYVSGSVRTIWSGNPLAMGVLDYASTGASDRVSASVFSTGLGSPVIGAWFYSSDSGESDTDGDDVPDDQDICPGGDDNVDTDGDFVPDFCDSCPYDPENDADGDGFCGDSDVCAGGDDSYDPDGDGTPEFCDVCPGDPGNDADNDGICELQDNCEAVANPDQTDSDGDGFGDACDLDADNDGIDDGDDNCPYDPNEHQEDYDGDNIGDVCDADVDGDDVVDQGDLCLNTMLGDPVNDSGCSIVEICPCEHPVGGNKWKNHGAYVRCVAHTSEDFVESGLITEAEKDAIVSEAGGSSCGHKK